MLCQRFKDNLTKYVVVEQIHILLIFKWAYLLVLLESVVYINGVLKNNLNPHIIYAVIFWSSGIMDCYVVYI